MTKSDDTLVAIAVSYARDECRGIADPRERVQRAMAAVQDFWLSTDEGVRYSAAVAAALLETTDEDEHELIERSARLAANVAAVLNKDAAVSSKAQDALSEEPLSHPKLPLLGMWLDARRIGKE